MFCYYCFVCSNNNENNNSKVLETNLNGGNIIKEISIWEVSLLRYSAAFIDWNCEELTQLDRRTRKLMTMHNALHPKINVDPL